MCGPWRITAGLGLLFLLSCNSRQAALPIREDKLIEVLIDVHVAESAAQGLRGATRDSVINTYYEQICEIHSINRADLETAVEMLQKDPRRMEALYARIMTEMERQDAEMEGEE